jgi:O-antigen/teichoic acid export membrane protein
VASVTSRRGRRLRAAGTSALVIAAATVVANVLAYALFLVLNRALSPNDLGAVAALLNLTIISGVLALALQLVAARHVATAAAPVADAARAPSHPADALEAEGSALATGLVLGLVVTGTMLLASPLVAAAFGLDGVLPAALVALTVLPTYLTYAAQGCLLGRERFGLLGLVFVVVALGRFVAGAGAALAGIGVTGVLALTAVAAWLACGLVLLFVSGGARRLRDGLQRTWVSAVVHGATATSALLVVSYMDVPLARAFLSPTESGEYAVLALFSKAALWGPAFLATVFYPRMARATTRRSVLLAVGSTAVIAALGVAFAAVFAEQLVVFVGGPDYAQLASLVPLFTAAGATWSVAQVLVYWRLSRGDHRLGYAVWTVAVLAATTIVLWRHGSIAEIASTVLAGGLAVCAYGLLLLARTKSSASPASSEPAPGTGAEQDVPSAPPGASSDPHPR